MNSLVLAFRLFRRDARAGELSVLALAILIAVACLTSVSLLGDRLERALVQQASQLLGGDLLVQADHPLPATLTVRAQRALQTAQSVGLRSMLGFAERFTLAGVKAVSENYPLRGEIQLLDPQQNTRKTVHQGPAPGTLWIDEQLQQHLQVKIGDTLAVGRTHLRVAEVIGFETSREIGMAGFMPQALLNLSDLPATGLLVEGSRAQWQLYVAGRTEKVEDFQRWVTPRLQRGERIKQAGEASPAIEATLQQAQHFLRLTAALTLILAALATGLSARHFMQQHFDTGALLRCFGARKRDVLMIVLFEFVVLGMLAAIGGVMVAWCLQASLATLLESVLHSALPAAGWMPLWQGVLIGLCLVVGFALPQLLPLGQISPLRVLRRDLSAVQSAKIAWLIGTSVLVSLILWLAGDLSLGLIVALGFTVAFVMFALFSAVVLWGLGHLGNGEAAAGHAYGWRYGLRALRRRVAGSVMQISAVGLGLAVLLLLVAVRTDLLDNWQKLAPVGTHNHFVLNIQPHQTAAVSDFFVAHGLDQPEILPMIRGRLLAVNGQEIKPGNYTNVRAQRLAERQFNLSYARHVPPGNRITDGTWLAGHAKGVPGFSVEKGLAETLQLGLGDQVRFDVSGKIIEARITSVRELEWQSMQVNFFFIAAPGLLEQAPASWISSFYLSPERRSMVSELVRAFPNLSVIDIGEVIAQVQRVAHKLILMVQFIFLFAVAAGVVVMLAALQTTHRERLQELAVLRMLGARDRQLQQALWAEFALMGAIAAILAFGLAIGMTWALAHFVFQLDFIPRFVMVIPVVLVMMIAMALTGALATRKLLKQPPLQVLQSLT